MVTVNSSINLFVYCGFGERFRNELKKMVRPLTRRIKRAGVSCCGLGWWGAAAAAEGDSEAGAFREDEYLRTLAGVGTTQARLLRPGWHNLSVQNLFEEELFLTRARLFESFFSTEPPIQRAPIRGVQK